MHLDVLEYQAFYAGALGQATAELLRRRLASLLPDLTGARVLGFGYPLPYLSLAIPQAERVIAFMPGRQGVAPWPPDKANAAVLVSGTELPLPESSVDCVLVSHGLENETPESFLREIWRVLTPEGHLVVVVPNRTGIWARLDRTPFGNGHPYNLNQLRRLLRHALFVPRDWASALYFPPSKRPLGVKALLAFENIGDKFWRKLAGVIIVVAGKEIYRLQPGRATESIRKTVMVPTQ